jgi:DNA processing protein
VASQDDREALLVLLSLASLTARRLLELAAERGTASACLAAVRAGQGGSAADRTHSTALGGAAIGEALHRLGGRLIAVHDPEYPAALLDLRDPPAGLFVRGRGLDELEPRVSIVGARNCSPSGREFALVLGRGLARASVCVVSGGARGIDASAHEGALGEGGPTVAVLGCGLDVAYPPQNAELLDRVASSGALITEYPPGTKAEPFRFPARNRIVAAMSRGVVVVEGAQGSGSMITADHALEIGREVFAVPGPVTSELSAVPLSLIRDGATLIRGADDLLGDLGLRRPGPAPPRTPEAGADPGLAAVWEVLSTSDPPDVIASKSGLPLPNVISALVRLEMLGLVREVGGRYEKRLGDADRGRDP